jgi:nucleotide-binding universal stress UspA family protein
MQAEILVPLDGSLVAETVLPPALALARALAGSLTLLRVTPPTLGAEPLAEAIQTPVITYRPRAEDRDQADAYLAGVAQRFEVTGVPLRIVVLRGDPATAIVQYAQEAPDVRLIAMATHGRSGMSRWVFGSVAEKVLRATPTPLLLVRPDDDGLAPPPAHALPYRTIVVPLDGSAVAEQALDQAYEVATATGASLLLVAVAPEPGEFLAAEVGDIPVWMLEDRMAETERLHAYLQRQAARLLNAGLTVEIQVVAGSPATAILNSAAETGADLIVMATHGRSGLPRLWMGSVALQVVQSARTPVLLVRAQQARKPRAAESDPRVAVAHRVEKEFVAGGHS